MYRDKKWMEQALSVPGTTVLDVAQTAGCNEKTIRRWLKRHGLTTRPIAENAWLRQANHGEIERSALEVIEGELLGDGNLSSRSDWSARYQHSSKHEEYLLWLEQLLADGGVTCNPVVQMRAGGHKTMNPLWHFSTHSYTVMKDIYSRWYKDGRKVVPTDLVLTPKMALHWYLGDGCLLLDKRCKNPITGVRLSTDSFTLKEVAFLADQMGDHKPYIGRYQKNHEERGYRLILNKSFLEWLGPCPDEIQHIYGYKWSGKPK